MSPLVSMLIGVQKYEIGNECITFTFLPQPKIPWLIITEVHLLKTMFESEHFQPYMTV